MVQTLGRFPEPWWNSRGKRHLYFDGDGKPKSAWANGIPLAVEYPLLQQIRDIGAEDGRVCPDDREEVATSLEMLGEGSILEPSGRMLAEDEVYLFANLIKKVVRYNPDERLPITEIIGHLWFLKGIQTRRIVVRLSVSEGACMNFFQFSLTAKSRSTKVLIG